MLNKAEAESIRFPSLHKNGGRFQVIMPQFLDYPFLQSTIIAIIPAKIPAVIPLAAIGTAAPELVANVADEEVDVETPVELVTVVGVAGVTDAVDEDEDADVDVEGTRVESVDSEVGIKLEINVDGVGVVSVTMPVPVPVPVPAPVSDVLLELKLKFFMVRMKNLEMLTQLWQLGSPSWL